MNEKYTHVTLLIDRSGSMQKIRTDMVSGIKSYLSNFKPSTPEDKCLVNIYDFDDRVEVVCENTQVQMVGNYDLKPRGWTQLLDAMGDTITRMGKQFADLPENQRPGKVLFLIVTDGEENKSTRFNLTQIKEMVAEQKSKYNWEFVFVGAGLENFHDANGIGVRSGSQASYTSNSEGIQRLWKDVAGASVSHRNMTHAAYVQQVQDSSKGFFQVSNP